MSTATIRERLFEYIRFADDKKVGAIYTMVEDDIIERLDLWEDKDFLKEIDRRIEEIETGKVTGSTWEQVKARSKA
jgi:putative addiction module component (TIGR02574 family)